MAEACVEPMRCQTFMSGWMDGKHPKVGTKHTHTLKMLIIIILNCLQFVPCIMIEEKRRVPYLNSLS